jgi:hydroxymethylglutaryl-CoA synthase
LAGFSHLADKEESYTDRELEKACLGLTKDDFASKVFPSTLAGRNLGNSYTGALYAGLASLIASDRLSQGERVLMFSYGSGLAASLYSIRVAGSVEEQRAACDLLGRLERRVEASPEDFSKAMEMRQQVYGRSDYEPMAHPSERLVPGAYFLTRVDHQHRRSYVQVPPSGLRQQLERAQPQGVKPIVQQAARMLRAAVV